MKQYTKIPVLKPRMSTFDLTHEHKTTINMGELVPILCQEVVPGDVFRINYEAIIKLQPLIAPILHRINTKVEFFFVPNRLVWNDWEDFITKGQTGELAPNFPKFVGLSNAYYANSLFKINGLADYLGVPVNRYPNTATAITPFSQLPFRAYQLIYNEWYRDQNLQTEIEIPKDSLDINITSTTAFTNLMTLRRRGWEKDYFTSSLPDAQRGDPVVLPLGTSAPLSSNQAFVTDEGDPVPNQNVGSTFNLNSRLSASTGGDVHLEADVDLTQASAATVEDLRTVFAIQRWKEALMRFGSRYREVIKGLFGVTPEDYRLDVPEYLAGGRLPIQIAEVVQTSQTDTTAQGTMAGHGVSAGDFTGFTKAFREHGFIIGIISIQPRTAYCQGLERKFTKFDVFDYATPQFMHLGEEPVYNKEVYLQNASADDEEFGYQPRYMDYRVNSDRVSGEFRDGLSYWHLGRIFPSAPALNSDFITCNPDTRIFPVITDPTGKFKKVLVMGLFKINAIRPVSKYGEPR